MPRQRSRQLLEGPATGLQRFDSPMSWEKQNKFHSVKHVSRVTGEPLNPQEPGVKGKTDLSDTRGNNQKGGGVSEGRGRKPGGPDVCLPSPPPYRQSCEAACSSPTPEPSLGEEEEPSGLSFYFCLSGACGILGKQHQEELLFGGELSVLRELGMCSMFILSIQLKMDRTLPAPKREFAPRTVMRQLAFTLWHLVHQFKFRHFLHAHIRKLNSYL